MRARGKAELELCDGANLMSREYCIPLRPPGRRGDAVRGVGSGGGGGGGGLHTVSRCISKAEWSCSFRAVRLGLKPIITRLAATHWRLVSDLRRRSWGWNFLSVLIFLGGMTLISRVEFKLQGDRRFTLIYIQTHRHRQSHPASQTVPISTRTIILCMESFVASAPCRNCTLMIVIYRLSLALQPNPQTFAIHIGSSPELIHLQRNLQSLTTKPPLSTGFRPWKFLFHLSIDQLCTRSHYSVPNCQSNAALSLLPCMAKNTKIFGETHAVLSIIK